MVKKKRSLAGSNRPKQLLSLSAPPTSQPRRFRKRGAEENDQQASEPTTKRKVVQASQNNDDPAQFAADVDHTSHYGTEGDNLLTAEEFARLVASLGTGNLSSFDAVAQGDDTYGGLTYFDEAAQSVYGDQPFGAVDFSTDSPGHSHDSGYATTVFSPQDTYFLPEGQHR